MKKRVLILIMFFVVVIGNISAFNFENRLYGLESEPVTIITFDNNTGSVNVSDWWDDLDTPADISIFVPYSGATANVNLNNKNLTNINRLEATTVVSTTIITDFLEDALGDDEINPSSANTLSLGMTNLFKQIGTTALQVTNIFPISNFVEVGSAGKKVLIGDSGGNPTITTAVASGISLDIFGEGAGVIKIEGTTFDGNDISTAGDISARDLNIDDIDGDVADFNVLKSSNYNNLTSLTDTLYAKYQFTTNDFNGSGTFNTTGFMNVGALKVTGEQEIESNIQFIVTSPDSGVQLKLDAVSGQQVQFVLSADDGSNTFSFLTNSGATFQTSAKAINYRTNSVIQFTDAAGTDVLAKFNLIDDTIRMGDPNGPNYFLIDETGDISLVGSAQVVSEVNFTENSTFIKDVIIEGTLYGGSPVKIAGINITDNLFSHIENKNSSLRFTLQNLNDSTNATAIITAGNDVGGSMSIGIGSSKFMIGIKNYFNVTALFSKSRGKMVFANFYNQPFQWLYNPSDDNDPNNLVELMRLDGNGLNVSVFNTGDVISNEIEAYFGRDYGAIAVGNVELFVSNISLSGLDLNGTFVTRNRDGKSDIKFAWVGKNNKVRLAIPKEGTAFALYNPRSEMIGGELGQTFDDGIINCTAQGYSFIDCSTDITGADLGVQDDIEFWGSLFGGNGSWNVSDEGNLNTLGNITSQNVFIPQYVYSHTNATMIMTTVSEWVNVTFAQEDDYIKQGISHTYNDVTNTSYTINSDGIYSVEFDFDIIDVSASSTDIDVAGRVVYSNGTEVIGSVFETDITKKNIEVELSHSFLAEFLSGDIIIFQFVADDVDVQISSHKTFGVHPDSASVEIIKEANL